MTNQFFRNKQTGNPRKTATKPAAKQHILAAVTIGLQLQDIHWGCGYWLHVSGYWGH